MVCSSSKLPRDYLIQHPHYRWGDPRSRSHSYRLSDSSVQTSLSLIFSGCPQKTARWAQNKANTKDGTVFSSSNEKSDWTKSWKQLQKVDTFQNLSWDPSALWSKLRACLYPVLPKYGVPDFRQSKTYPWAIFILAEGWHHTLSKQKTAKSLSSALENSLISLG